MTESVSANATLTAKRAGLVRCAACGTLHKVSSRRCRRCNSRLNQRIPRSIQRTWALLTVGIIAYVPAMILPVLHTRSFSDRSSDTIVSGVLELFNQGNPGIALIIFVASVCIPLLKFVVIGALALSLQRQWPMSTHMRHRLHRFTELIGRWSMIDVFVVAVLAALIQLGTLMTILPGPGIDAFAVSVIFTMFAAASLDPRLFWDNDAHGYVAPS